MSIGERATAALRPANQNPFHPSQWGSTILWPFVGSSNGSFGEREGGHLLRIFYCAHQPLPRIVHIIWSYFGCSANEESTSLFLWKDNQTLLNQWNEASDISCSVSDYSASNSYGDSEVILECQCWDGSWRLRQLHTRPGSCTQVYQPHSSLAIVPPTAALSGLQPVRSIAARPTWAHRDHRRSIPTAFHQITALLESHQQANLANFTVSSKSPPTP